MPNILIVDDELSIRESFSLILEGKYRLLLAASGEAALKLAADQKIDLAYLDIRMPGLNGLETLARLKQIDPELEIIMVTAVNDVQKASEAIKQGARDYVVKPFDVEHISKLTEQILRKRSLLVKSRAVKQNLDKETPELIGQSDKISKLIQAIDRLKPDQRVLIQGEAGTEKHLVAQLIHEKSPRQTNVFRSLDLGANVALPQLKAKLFGWGKGSSTVDLSGQSGLLEQTKSGTLFINNLANLPDDLLQNLTAKKFKRLGSSEELAIETRLIGGSLPGLEDQNKPLFNFFSDVDLELPPLRARSSDIPLLINYFLEKYQGLYGQEAKLDQAAMTALNNYDWPGNTRQLASVIERLVLTATELQIKAVDLPLDLLTVNGDNQGNNFIDDFEQQYVSLVFDRCGQDKKRTAAWLGINPLLLETKL